MKYTGKCLTVNVTELFTVDLGALWGLECCPQVLHRALGLLGSLQWAFLELGAHWFLILPGGSQAHRVLEVLCSIQDGGVFSSRLSLLHHLGVQRALCYVSLLGESNVST